MHIICTTLNAKYIHTNLAIRYLKAYAQPEFHVELVEYTIKDPVLNIVTDLYRRKPDVVGFSCYIWNIEQTIEVIQLLKKCIQPSRSSSVDQRCHTMFHIGLSACRSLIISSSAKGKKRLNSCLLH